MESQNLENEDTEVEDSPLLEKLRVEESEESERMKVLVVGGGLSGGTLSYFLKSKKHFKITCWEKSRGLGGRAATKRSSKISGCQADTGLQYLTRYEKSARHDEIYKLLSEKGVISTMDVKNVANMRPGSEKMQHFKAINGTNTIAKTLWEETSAEVIKLQKLKSLDYSQNQVIAENEQGEKENFDLVVLTIPPPQITRDISFIPPIEKKVQETIDKVKFSARFALVYFFGGDYDIDTRVAASYAANRDDAIVYWNIDEAKRFGMDTEMNFRTIMFHFKKGLYTDMTPAEALPKLQEHVAKSFPNLPTPAEAVPHRWLFSQVDQKCPVSQGFLSLDDRIIICGDSFGTRGNFDGCVESASLTADHILSLLPNSSKSEK